MAVRKIPKNYLFVTGSFASQKNDQMNEFESPLEKEFMLLLEFDKRVEKFDTQPIIIPVPGVRAGYTPDVLIHYFPDPNSGEIPKPLLTDVKHTDELARNKEKYQKKFDEAERFANERGWEFRITTQHDIRTPRLENLKFLRAYRNISPSEQDQLVLFNMVKKIGDECSPKILLDHLAKNENDQLHWLPLIWHAVLHEDLLIDWNQQLHNDTSIQLAQCHLWKK